jgi:hypothetical protein
LQSYRFTYGYTKFYPAVQDAEGKSLMASPGDVFEFEAGPPDDGAWVPVGPPAEFTPPAAPEPAPEPVQPEPEPVPVPVVPEPAPAPVAPAEPAPVAVPNPFPAAPPAQPFMFPGFTAPPVRA